MKSTTLILLALAVVGMASGCTGKNPGNATPGPTSGGDTVATTTSKPATVPGGPDIDLGKFAAKPCDLLQADQLAQLGSFKAPEPGSNTLGPSCKWRAQKVLEGASYTVTLVTGGSTFEEISKNAKKDAVNRETKIADYSAVSSDQTNGKGNCGTAVGVSSKGALLVQAGSENENSAEYKDTCAASEKVAALVVGNLKG